MAAITNSEGSRVTGFERRLQDGGVGSVISQALNSKDYRKAADKFEYRLIERGGEQFIQLRKKPGKLASFFSSAQTKARVADERKKGIEAVMTAFSKVESQKIDSAVNNMKSERGSLRPTADGATQFAQSTVGYIKAMHDAKHIRTLKEEKGDDVDVAELQFLLGMDKEIYDASPLSTHTFFGVSYKDGTKRDNIVLSETKEQSIVEEQKRQSFEYYNPDEDKIQSQEKETVFIKPVKRDNSIMVAKKNEDLDAIDHQQIDDDLEADKNELMQEQWQAFLYQQIGMDDDDF